jgi:hypothetical protein
VERLRVLVDKIICRLSAARKAQLVNLALYHIAEYHIAEVSYFRLAKQGVRPDGIIDIGAYQSDWTRLIAKFFAHASILMIEAQAEEGSFLDSVRAELPLADYLLCVLGGSQVIFNIVRIGSSIHSEPSNCLAPNVAFRCAP